jgi:hypothetical protein
MLNYTNYAYLRYVLLINVIAALVPAISVGGRANDPLLHATWWNIDQHSAVLVVSLAAILASALVFLVTHNHPHFESPQYKQVWQPSSITTAAVLHFAQSCAPSGKCDFEKASVCLVRASNSARFSSTILR